MAYNEHLADRIRNVFSEESTLYTEKKMFGGLCFMVDEKMCVGIVKEQLMARVGTDAYEECVNKDDCSEMNFTGRSMKGFVFVNSEGIDIEDDLNFYIKKAIAFNPLAKKSPKKKKKK